MSNLINSTLYDILSVFAAANGIITKEEEDYLTNLAQKCKIPINKKTIESILNGNTPIQTLDEILNRVPNHPLTHKIIYREASFLCLSDGNIDDDEKKLLNHLSDRFNLNTDLTQAIRMWCEHMLEWNKIGSLLIQEENLEIIQIIINSTHEQEGGYPSTTPRFKT
jgi:hypothetical protein